MNGLIKFHTLKEYLDETNFPKMEPLVEDLVSRQELTLLSATAKTGKTWLALHMGLSVANGTSFLGAFPTVKSKVLLIQTEVSHPQFRERILQVLGQIPSPWNEENLVICQERFRIDTPDGLELLGGLIAHTKAALVILDPFYTLHKKDEDKAKDIAPMLSDLKMLCVDNNAAILLVHHQGKSSETNGSQTGHQSRGSSALADVPDNLWSLRRTKEEGQLKLYFELRNLVAKDPISLKLSAEMAWEVLGAVDCGKSSDSAKLAAIVRAKGELSKGALIQYFMAEANVGKRTAEARIGLALEVGALQKRQAGKEVIYFIPQTIDATPQERRLLGDCESAEDTGAIQRKPQEEHRAVAEFENASEFPELKDE